MCSVCAFNCTCMHGDLVMASNCVVHLDNEARGGGLPKNQAWQI